MARTSRSMGFALEIGRSTHLITSQLESPTATHSPQQTFGQAGCEQGMAHDEVDVCNRVAFLQPAR